MIIDESNDDLNGYECCNKIDGRQRGMTTRMVTNAVTKLMGAHDVQRTVSRRLKLWLLSSLERDVLFWRRTPTLLTYLSLGSNIFGEGRRRFVLVPLELA